MLSRKYDSLFQQYGHGLPVNFLRALSKKESDLNPNETQGPAWGLMQVVEVVRDGYNKRYGTSYLRSDLLNPRINVNIASELLKRIGDNYHRFHPHTPNMQRDFSNPEYVKLLLAGWNSGYSEAGGVGKVAKFLENSGIPVTHDNVFAFAGAAGAALTLQNSAKQRWQRDVADLFYKEGGPNNTLGTTFIILGAAGFIAWGIRRYYHG